MDRGGWQATVHGAAESDTNEQLITKFQTLNSQFLITVPQELIFPFVYLKHLSFKTET